MTRIDVIPFLFCICALWTGCSDENASQSIDTSTGSDLVADTQTDTATHAARDTAIITDTVSGNEGDCLADGDQQSSLIFINQCDDALTIEGSNIESGALAPGQSACRHLGSDVAPISSIRFWGYIGPDPGGEHHTLAEMTLNTDFYDFDWYNISHVDAFNLPMAIVPLEMPDCPVKSCPDDLLQGCPEEGRYFIGGELASCVSPDRDNPDSVVAQYFDEGCSDAYAWSGDDAESMAACAGEDYAIVFCP